MQDFGERERKSMKKKAKYTNGPIDEFEIMEDFLPSPENLVKKEDNVRVTINLNRSSINYFKKLADSSHTKYQRIIRNLLDYYASHQKISAKH